jgi:ribonuclease Z
MIRRISDGFVPRGPDKKQPAAARVCDNRPAGAAASAGGKRREARVTRSFEARLVNGGFGDPALYVDFLHERRALLFDIGEIAALRPGEILRVSDVFVSHTHIDHFCGFDRLLRVMLNRDKTVRLHGPEGLIANVAGKLAGYTWNLVDNYRLRLQVQEIGPRRVRRVTFSCRERFRARTGAREAPFDGTVLTEAGLSVEARHLDHAVPCLGFRLNERVHLNVNGDRLRRLGWEVGPWLGRVKALLRAGRPGTTPVRVPILEGGRVRLRSLPLARIEAEAVIATPGQTLAYVTDVRRSPGNDRGALALAAGADHFYCEAAFLERDADHAERKHHLTARQAGELAHLAGARRLTIFHFSPKYGGEEALLRAEAAAAHGGAGGP